MNATFNILNDRSDSSHSHSHTHNVHRSDTFQNETVTCSSSSTKTSFSLFLVNVRSICNKLFALKLFIDHYKPAILAVTESWGRDCLPDSLITPEGYILFPRDRDDRSGGGVFMLVKQDFSPSPYCFPPEDPVSNFEDSVWCSIRIPPSKTLLVGCAYRSPSSNKYNDSLLERLFDLTSDSNFDFRVIVGDFNCPNVDWVSMSSAPSNSFLLDSCQNNFLTQIVQKPTRHDNILDLIFVNDPSFISHTDVLEVFPGSDHCIVSCHLTFNMPRSSDPHNESPRKDGFNFRKADWQRYRSILSDVQWLDCLRDKTVDEMWHEIKSIILSAANSTIPKHNRRRHVYGVPLTGEVRDAFRQRKRIFRSLSTSVSPLAQAMKIRADDRLKRSIAESRRSFELSIAKDRKINPKRFWSHVRSSFANKAKVTAVLDSTVVMH